MIVNGNPRGRFFRTIAAHKASDRGMLSGQRGFALLLVLWTLVLVSLLITRLNATGRTELRIAANLHANAEVRAAADGAVNEAMFRLSDASSLHWAADGTTRQLDWPNARIDIRMESLTGRINPNLAPVELLAKLLRLVGNGTSDPDTLAAAIVAWRTPAGSQKAALLAQYRAAGLGYGPPGAPFETLDELNRVIGMTPVLLQALRPHLSLYPLGAPDESQADPIVAASLHYSAPGTLTQMPLDPTGQTTLAIVEIEADATAKSGARFARRAVIRLDPARPRGGTILAWEPITSNID